MLNRTFKTKTIITIIGIVIAMIIVRYASAQQQGIEGLWFSDKLENPPST